VLKHLAKYNQSLPDENHDENLQKYRKNKGPRYSCSAPFVKFSTSATRIIAKPNFHSFATFCQFVEGFESC